MKNKNSVAIDLSLGFWEELSKVILFFIFGWVVLAGAIVLSIVAYDILFKICVGQ